MREKDGHYPNGSLRPIYPSHGAIPLRPRHRSFNWPGTQCLLKHSASLEKGSVGECGKLSHPGNIRWKRVGRGVRSICVLVCACGRMHVCVCSRAPTTHINVENFMFSHVDNEQLEFW